ncbi:mediator of RNA polymerase II transcription subunit 27 [Silene latifolia]|uniref:mediator of RNA polymerase II transcription subunit 27 n=1 Tax=Silene latifolia TaxID=37657 RepID=UPI003D76EC91
MLQQQHQLQQHSQQQQPPTSTTTPSGEVSGEAPPKQVAMAMDRLGQASRLISDIRIGADRLLEALFLSSESNQHPSKTLSFIATQESAMRQHLKDLRDIGRQLEASGVLTDALRSRSNSWGLHMPLVCPDGAVVAYAWKRQLAGQAGASAVDRTRLALKSFTDQRRRFFPHLESASKKQCVSPESLVENLEEPSDNRTLTDTLKCLEKEVPNMKISTYERLDWLKRASSLPASAKEEYLNASFAQTYNGSSSLRSERTDGTPSEKVAVIELLVPSVFRAIVSLHPIGSTDPDAVAFFSPDEGGSYVHARGVSVYNVFRHITDFSNTALQYFLGNKPEMALYLLLNWISSYQDLFSQACSKCGRILSMDRQLAYFLPPVHRSYQNLIALKIVSVSPREQSLSTVQAYHVGCFPSDV